MALHATGARPSKRVDPGGYSTNELSAINCSPEETAIGRKFCHAVTRISVLSTLLGGGKTTERLLVRISIETSRRQLLANTVIAAFTRRPDDQDSGYCP